MILIREVSAFLSFRGGDRCILGRRLELIDIDTLHVRDDFEVIVFEVLHDVGESGR
jgi:hypothetical protein